MVPYCLHFQPVNTKFYTVEIISEENWYYKPAILAALQILSYRNNLQTTLAVHYETCRPTRVDKSIISNILSTTRQ